MEEVDAKCWTNTRECAVDIMRQSSAGQGVAAGGVATATANPLGSTKTDAQRSVLPLTFSIPCFEKNRFKQQKSQTYPYA